MPFSLFSMYYYRKIISRKFLHEILEFILCDYYYYYFFFKKSRWNSNGRRSPPFSSIYRGRVPQFGSPRIVYQLAHYVAGLGHFNLAETTTLQPRSQPISTNQVARLGRSCCISSEENISPFPVTCVEGGVLLSVAHVNLTHPLNRCNGA